MAGQGEDRFAAAREALRHDSPLWRIEHLDITCDGCEQEPIVGHRFKCSACEDIDLCGACMRALVAARIKMSQEAAPRAAPPRQGGRPRRWVSKLHSRDLAERWAALQTAVPCLHPSHKFQKVLDGPERAVVFTAVVDSSSGSSGAASGAAAGGEAAVSDGKQQAQAPQQQQAESAAAALAAESLQDGGSAAAVAGESGSPSAGDQLEEFLATFRPSACSCSNVAWLVVEVGGTQQQVPFSSGSSASTSAGGGSGDGSGASPGGPSLEERVDAAVEEWEMLAGSGRKLSAADVDRLAAKHRILKGKWMLFARSGEEADVAWAAVAHAACASQPLCGSAKVSSTAPPPDNSHVIVCYVDDYQDSEDVQRVCRGLQRAVPPGLLQDKRLLFKPDIYTHLGIYSRNEWGIKPSTHEARLP